MKFALPNHLLSVLKTGLLSASLLCVATFPLQSMATPPKEDIKFIDLEGKTTKLSDYQGKWVVVNIWATWCPPCLVEIPDLVLFHEAHKDKDAIVIGVNYEANENSKIKAFADSQMINYPVVRFEGKVDGRTTPFGPLQGLPTSYMVSPDGTVVAARTGMVDQKMLEEFMANYAKMKAAENTTENKVEDKK